MEILALLRRVARQFPIQPTTAIIAVDALARTTLADIIVQSLRITLGCNQACLDLYGYVFLYSRVLAVFHIGSDLTLELGHHITFESQSVDIIRTPGLTASLSGAWKGLTESGQQTHKLMDSGFARLVPCLGMGSWPVGFHDW